MPLDLPNMRLEKGILGRAEASAKSQKFERAWNIQKYEVGQCASSTVFMQERRKLN